MYCLLVRIRRLVYGAGVPKWRACTSSDLLSPPPPSYSKNIQYHVNSNNEHIAYCNCSICKQKLAIVANQDFPSPSPLQMVVLKISNCVIADLPTCGLQFDLIYVKWLLEMCKSDTWFIHGKFHCILFVFIHWNIRTNIYAWIMTGPAQVQPPDHAPKILGALGIRWLVSVG